MISLPPPIASRYSLPLAWVLLCLISIGGVVACRSTPEPTPTPAPTIRPTAIPTVEIAPRTIIAAKPTKPRPQRGPAQLPPFTLSLPDDWVHLTLTDDARQEQLTALATEIPSLAEWVETVTVSQTYTTSLVVAWPENNREMGVVAQLTPRQEQLSMPRYIAIVEEGLRAEPKVKIHWAEQHYTLHSEMPVGYLHYLSHREVDTMGMVGTAGYQFLLFDPSATVLLSLTFVEPTDKLLVVKSITEPSATQALFESIVQQITFED